MSTQVVEVEAGGLTFSVRTAGPADGRPVILLHGFPQTSLSFSQSMDTLAAASYRVVAPDQRGYSPGARPDEVADYRLDKLIGDVAALADALGIDRFDLVGHDWGGLVAWAFAFAHPERVRTLTAVSTPHPRAFATALTSDADQQERSTYVDLFRQPDVPEALLLGDDGSGSGLRQLYSDSGIDEESAEVFIATLRQPGAMTAALNWYRANDLKDTGAVGVISVPTMYVWSDADVALGRVAAEASASYVVGPYQFEVLEGVGHWIPDLASDRLDALLLDHLAQTS